MNHAPMTIEQLLNEWSVREKTFMGNIAVATNFFSTRFSRLQGKPEEYALAFSALSRHIPWKDLINYEVPMRQAIFETTALYASKAGDAPCASGPSTRRVWSTNVANACRSFQDGFTMPAFMQSILAIPALPDEYKLDFCRHAHPSVWCSFVGKDTLIAMLDPDENERLEQLPWHHRANPDNIQRTTNTAWQQRLVAAYCPQLGPILLAVLPQKAWRRRDTFLAAAALISTPSDNLPLPEGFVP